MKGARRIIKQYPPLPFIRDTRQTGVMTISRICTAVLCTLTLTGCVAFPFVVPASLVGGDAADPTDPCGAKGYTSLLGASLAAVTLPADLNDRVIRPGEVRTQDFDASRLNIEVTEDGTIIGLSCG